MTPRIPDFRRELSSSRAFFLSARSARLALVLVLLLSANPFRAFAAQSQSSDNSAAKPAPAQGIQQAAAPSSNPEPAKSGDKPAKKPAHQKKVITEDDLVKPAKPVSLNDADSEENNPICDLSCEQVLRGQWGYGPDREGEFRSQLTLARHEISYDRVWNGHLGAALQALGDWCDIQRQKAQILGKGDAAYYARDSVNSRFAEREQKLVLQHRNESGYMTQHIEAIQRFAPFRATLMQYEVSEATTRVCSDYTMP